MSRGVRQEGRLPLRCCRIWPSVGPGGRAWGLVVDDSACVCVCV